MVTPICKQLTMLSFVLPSCGLKGFLFESQKVWLPLGQTGKFDGLPKPSKWGATGWMIGLIFNSHTADFLRREGSTIRSFTLNRVHFLKKSHYMKLSWWGHSWQESLRWLTQKKRRRRSCAPSNFWLDSFKKITSLIFDTQCWLCFNFLRFY